MTWHKQNTQGSHYSLQQHLHVPSRKAWCMVHGTWCMVLHGGGCCGARTQIEVTKVVRKAEDQKEDTSTCLRVPAGSLELLFRNISLGKVCTAKYLIARATAAVSQAAQRSAMHKEEQMGTLLLARGVPPITNQATQPIALDIGGMCYSTTNTYSMQAYVQRYGCPRGTPKY